MVSAPQTHNAELKNLCPDPPHINIWACALCEDDKMGHFKTEAAAWKEARSWPSATSDQENRMETLVVATTAAVEQAKSAAIEAYVLATRATAQAIESADNM